jgi:hypothetical protein
MSDTEVSEEIIVYGDAIEGGGGGTDVISIPADFYWFYLPLDPTVVNIPPPDGGGGGGGDVDNAKEAFADASEYFFWATVAFGLVALAPGAGVAVVAGVSVAMWATGAGLLAGVAAYQADKAANDPPQPNYARPAQATPRTTTLTPEQTTVMEPLLAAEQQLRLFIDTIECAQGAFLAADAPWVQRHTLAAAEVYRDAGSALLAAADSIEQCWTDWTAQLPGAQAPEPARLRKLLRKAAPQCGLNADEQATVIGELESRLARATGPIDLPEALRHIRRFAKRLVEPSLIDVRFAFPKPADGA